METTSSAATPTTTAQASASGNYNVRELLELERKIYDESIEKQARQHEALLRGELDEYIAQCRPFENDRVREMEIAATRRQLNEQNARDLLAFEIKQAEDVYQEQRAFVKRRLIEMATQKRDRALKRLEQIDKGLAITCDEDMETRRLLNESRSAALTAPCILQPDGSLDTTALQNQLEISHQSNQAAFNLHHLEHNLPPASAIVADVVDEMERQRVFQKEMTDPDTVCSVVVDTKSGKVWVDLGDVFTVHDHVVLWSSLSDEEFYGQIVVVEKEKLALTLICGSRVYVSVAQLRKQLCTLRHQQQGTPPPETLSTSDDSAQRTPKRKRHRRKHTIGLRQKI